MVNSELIFTPLTKLTRSCFLQFCFMPKCRAHMIMSLDLLSFITMHVIWKLSFVTHKSLYSLVAVKSWQEPTFCVETVPLKIGRFVNSVDLKYSSVCWCYLTHPLMVVSGNQAFCFTHFWIWADAIKWTWNMTCPVMVTIWADGSFFLSHWATVVWLGNVHGKRKTKNGSNGNGELKLVEMSILVWVWIQETNPA